MRALSLEAEVVAYAACAWEAWQDPAMIGDGFLQRLPLLQHLFYYITVL